MKFSLATTTHSLSRKRCAGFTLLDFMLSLAMTFVFSGGALLVMKNTAPTAIDTKLIRDVAIMNRTIQIFRTNGGSLAGLTQPQDVVDSMKSGLATSSQVKMAVPEKNLIDPRLCVRLQTSMEAAGNEQRAYYNSNLMLFVIATSGGQGIKEFALNESLALKNYGEHNFHPPFEMASGWNLGRGFHSIVSKPKIASRISQIPIAQIMADSAEKSGDFLGLTLPILKANVETKAETTKPMYIAGNNSGFKGNSILQFMMNEGCRLTCESAFKAKPSEIKNTMPSFRGLDCSQGIRTDDEIYTTTKPIKASDLPITDELK